MTISVSVVSHAFFTEKGVSRSMSIDSCSISCAQGEDVNTASITVENVDAGNEKQERAFTAAKEMATQSAVKAHGRKRGNRKRGGRGRQHTSEKDAKMHMAVQDRTSPRCENATGLAEVLVANIREECSSVFGVVKEDLELYGLCHLPRTSERARLLKDKSGVVHIGVMVRNSDLSLRAIEEVLIQKDKAEQDVEGCHAQIRERAEEFVNLKHKYDKLTEEVLRLRTMVNRANRLRRESEKATEILRVEFEKLVKNLFVDCPERSLRAQEET